LVQYFPVYLDLRGRSCVVVGGGEVATRKVQSALEAGARVTVVSPTTTAALAALAETHEVVHHARRYRRGDLAGAFLAFAATDDPALDPAIAADAAAAGVLLNVADQPRFCTFIVPAVVARGPLSIAVSTAGHSPTLAKRVRDEVAQVIGPEYGLAAVLLGNLRPVLRTTSPDATERARVLAALVDSPLLAALRARDGVAVDAILARIVGAGTSLASLGMTLDPAAQA
jgi:precorrin-2 dehydrogenase/sirohydrochlorin ferrochelatase